MHFTTHQTGISRGESVGVGAVCNDRRAIGIGETRAEDIVADAIGEEREPGRHNLRRIVESEIELPTLFRL